MKIKSPLTSKKEAKPLCEAGADEFFCGIEPYSWKRKYKNFCINQRSTDTNFVKLADLERAIQIAHQHRVRVHVAVNAFFYLAKQYDAAYSIIKDILEVGADGIIFADPGLLLITDKNLLKNKDIVIGCDAAIFNSAAVRFYKRLGATRIVLPRSMTINEINDIIKIEASLDYEVFIINDLCFFEDGFCTYCKEGSADIKREGRGRKKIHLFSATRIPMRGYGGGCRTKFCRHKISLLHNQRLKYIKRFTFWESKHIQGCGACALFDFQKIGLTAVKILDRNLSTEDKIKATGFIKKSSALLSINSLSKTEYIRKCHNLFKQHFKVSCNQYDCYYPSVFMHNNFGHSNS